MRAHRLARARLGVGTGLVSVIGEDFAQPELDAMSQAGWPWGIDRPPEDGLLLGRVYHEDMNGRDTLETELNVLADFNGIPEAWRSAKYLMLGNIDPNLQASVLDR